MVKKKGKRWHQSRNVTGSGNVRVLEMFEYVQHKKLMLERKVVAGIGKCVESWK